ncbi:hypothetical protein EVAR_52277_1 [Eumeta japonica]|uniref:Sodium/potassium-transporting ATPase subunit beta-2 n=1 Tax=Eumeta variegata TaxID=151549 RepID=A0A4C1YPU3_EUMVA|nr:hypothetical protein EVAR_52277_1 [Eumeta japonica]
MRRYTGIQERNVTVGASRQDADARAVVLGRRSVETPSEPLNDSYTAVGCGFLEIAIRNMRWRRAAWSLSPRRAVTRDEGQGHAGQIFRFYEYESALLTDELDCFISQSRRSGDAAARSIQISSNDFRCRRMLPFVPTRSRSLRARPLPRPLLEFSARGLLRLLKHARTARTELSVLLPPGLCLLNNLNMVWVSCQGENPADRENIGPIQYYPYRGFPGYYFPFRNEEGYLSPLIAVHLQRPKTGMLINMECRAWARNIKYDRHEGIGMVHIEVMVD